MVYFDKSKTDPKIDWDYDKILNEQYPEFKWEVRNQARMNYVNGLEPYKSTEDSMSHWPETATAIGIKISMNDKIILNFCYGIDDLLSLIARPTPQFRGDKIKTFYDRIDKKGWCERWPNLIIINK